jgi:large subunit ribosomal protein L29
MAKKKNKKVEDVREMDSARLKEELATLKKEAFNLRFQQATGQLEKPSRIRDVRRRIARVNTFLRQKQEQAAQRA